MNLFAFDNQYRTGEATLVCGVDEAGRGPLAGPVYAAAVILPPDFVLPGLNDSKKLSAKKREELFDVIVQEALTFAIATATEQEIDEYNILNASLLAMERAVAGLTMPPDVILIDGNKTPPNLPMAQAVVQGDAKSAAIAAASILAKVERDRAMELLDREYPAYQFARHKGYPTKLHYQMLDEYGPSPVHRTSFLKKWESGKKP